MTMSFHTAYDIIAEGIASEDHPGDITQRLHTAGILAPDLPKPNIDFVEPSWVLSGTFDAVALYENKIHLNGLVLERRYHFPLEPEEAEALALALLAAVNRQKERNQ